MRKFLLSIPTGIPSLIITAIVAYLTLTSDPVGKEFLFFPGSDKVAHVLAFMFVSLTYLYDYAKHKNPHHTKLNLEMALTATAIVVGLLTEAGQLVISNGRSYDPSDIVADGIGAIIGFLAYRFYLGHEIRYFFSRRKHHHDY